MLTLLLLLLSLPFVSPVLVPLATTSLLQPIVDREYEREAARYRAFLAGCEGVDCAWRLAVGFNREFHFTYRVPVPKPRDLAARWDRQVLNSDFIDKLSAVLRTGACEDFARGFTKLVEDVLGYRTRIVALDGSAPLCDHAIPEVEVGGKWYVLDASYTTGEGPVEAHLYAEHLKERYPHIYGLIAAGECTLVDVGTGRDVAGEHGFKA